MVLFKAHLLLLFPFRTEVEIKWDKISKSAQYLVNAQQMTTSKSTASLQTRILGSAFKGTQIQPSTYYVSFLCLYEKEVKKNENLIEIHSAVLQTDTDYRIKCYIILMTALFFFFNTILFLLQDSIRIHGSQLYFNVAKCLLLLIECSLLWCKYLKIPNTVYRNRYKYTSK